MDSDMTELDRKALKEAALKATQGEWKWDSGVVPPDGPQTYADIYVWENAPDDDLTIIAEFNNQIPAGFDNARWIVATQPKNILSLLASLEEAEGRLEEANLFETENDAAFADLDARIEELTARAEAAELRERRRKTRMAEIDDAIWRAMQTQAEDVRVNGDDHRPMLEILQELHEQSRAALSDNEA